MGASVTEDGDGDGQIEQTIPQVDQNLVAVMKDEKACAELSEQVLGEAVADKGYHSNAVLKDQRQREIRTYISEPDRWATQLGRELGRA